MGKVLQPLPDYDCLSLVVEFQPLHDLLHSEYILVSVVLRTPLPYLVQVPDVQQAIFSSVVIYTLIYSFVIVEPGLDLLSFEGYLTVPRHTSQRVGVRVTPKDILFEGIELRVVPFASIVVVADSIVRSNRGDWRRAGSDPPVRHLSNG